MVHIVLLEPQSIHTLLLYEKELLGCSAKRLHISRKADWLNLPKWTQMKMQVQYLGLEPIMFEARSKM